MNTEQTRRKAQVLTRELWVLFSHADAATDRVAARDVPLWYAAAKTAARHRGRDVRVTASTGDPAVVTARIINTKPEPSRH